MQITILNNLSSTKLRSLWIKSISGGQWLRLSDFKRESEEPTRNGFIMVIWINFTLLIFRFVTYKLVMSIQWTFDRAKKGTSARLQVYGGCPKSAIEVLVGSNPDATISANLEFVFSFLWNTRQCNSNS